MTNKRVREGLKSPGQALVKANVHGHDPALAAPVDARRCLALSTLADSNTFTGTPLLEGVLRRLSTALGSRRHPEFTLKLPADYCDTVKACLHAFGINFTRIVVRQHNRDAICFSPPFPSPSLHALREESSLCTFSAMGGRCVYPGHA